MCHSSDALLDGVHSITLTSKKWGSIIFISAGLAIIINSLLRIFGTEQVTIPGNNVPGLWVRIRTLRSRQKKEDKLLTDKSG